MKPKFLFVTGNVASGKTTCCQILSKNIPNSLLVPEPMRQNLFLPWYASNQKRWGLACQVNYFLDYVEVLFETVQKQKAQYYIVDAGAWTNWFIYGKYLEKNNVILKEEFELYERLCQTIMKAYSYPEPDLLIMTQAGPKKCFDRMNARGRGFELKGHKLSYLKDLDLMLKNMKVHFEKQGVKILEIDSQNLNFKSEKGEKEITNQVLSFLK